MGEAEEANLLAVVSVDVSVRLGSVNIAGARAAFSGSAAASSNADKLATSHVVRVRT
jgi:hypothetical protein